MKNASSFCVFTCIFVRLLLKIDLSFIPGCLSCLRGRHVAPDFYCAVLHYFCMFVWEGWGREDVIMFI